MPDVLRLATCALVWPAVAIAPRLAAQAPPTTDIWIAPITRQGDSLTIGAPRNVTSRPGYDNQPAFTTDSKALLFTSVREDAQADIYRYDLTSRATTRVTTTAESEYSATITPDRAHMSVIRVERDSTQRLWRFPLRGGEPSLVLEAVKPVGYHAWVDDTTVALFVLGQPATLRVANPRTGAVLVADSGIGRALQKLPGREAVSYAKRADSTTWQLRVLRTSTDCRTVACSTAVAELRGAGEYHVWLSDGSLLAVTRVGAEAPRLMRLVPRASSTPPLRVTFMPTGIGPATSSLRNVSRLAVSPDERWVAIVADP